MVVQDCVLLYDTGLRQVVAKGLPQKRKRGSGREGGNKRREWEGEREDGIEREQGERRERIEN